MSRYRFTRYVNFAAMAEGIVVEADRLRKAIRKAVLLCDEPDTVLVLDADRIEELESANAELEAKIAAARNVKGVLTTDGELVYRSVVTAALDGASGDNK